MHISTETYQANLDDAWTYDGQPCIDIDTRGDDLDHPYFPNFGATTQVIIPVSDEYEPEVYRKALAEEGWEVVSTPEKYRWTLRQAQPKDSAR